MPIHKMTPGSRERHSDDTFRDDSSPKKFAANDANVLKNVTITATDPVTEGRNLAGTIGKEALAAYKAGDTGKAQDLKDQQQDIRRDVEDMEFARKKKNK